MSGTALDVDDTLFDWREKRDARALGPTYNEKLDGDRLCRQAREVHQFLSDMEWHTLAEIGAHASGTQTAHSARVREIRAWLQETSRGTVERRRLPGAERSGIWQYRIVAAK